MDLESMASGSDAIRRMEQVRYQVDERLSCAVCLNRFDDPRMLDCRHSFCRRCLEDVVLKRPLDPEYPLGGDELVCPKCRAVTKLGQGGIEALPVNFDLKDVVELFDQQELSMLSPFSPDTSHQHILGGPSVGALPQCSEHHRSLEFFCCECDQLLCGNCVVKPVHRGHLVREAKDVVREEHEHLRTSCLEKAEKAQLNVTVGVTEVADTIRALRGRGEDIKRRIQEEFQKLHEALRQREQVLIGTTDNIIAKKVTRLQEQYRVLTKSKMDLEQQVNTLKGILTRQEDYSFLTTKKVLISEVTRCVEEAQGKVREPVETPKDGPDLHLADSLVTEASQYGEVFCQPYPPRFVAKGDGLKKAFLEKEATFVIHAYDRFGQRSFVSGTEIAVTIQSPDSNDSTPVKVTERCKGEYTVCYTPQFIGLHTVNITAGAVPIHNSTANVVVFNTKDYLSLRLPHTRITKHQVHPEVSTMRGVCTLPNDNIVFADAFCLRVVTPEGQLVRTIGSFGNGPGQFSLPLSVAANRQGHVFVTDSTNNRIEKFSSSDGHFISMVGTGGAKHGCFNCPEGIALLGDDRIFVVDRGNYRVQVFQQKNWRYVTSFGKKGSGPGQFESPRDVAIDTKWNRVLVSDSGNLRVQVLTLDGKPLQQFGPEKVSFTFPYFLSVDSDGFILVTETRSHNIAILTPQGKLIRRLGSPGEGAGQFRTPYGICVNSQGQAIISDSSTHCLQVF